jgi:hypothetical protein
VRTEGDKGAVPRMGGRAGGGCAFRSIVIADSVRL